MKIEQLFTGCLAEMAYYIESNGEAAIVDPLRETDPYIKMAEKDGAKIKYIFLTHFHADFVSGQVDLAKKTGAKIVFGPNAQADYEIYNGKDGEEFPLGDIKIKLLHRINNIKAIKPRFKVSKDEWVKWEERFLPNRWMGILIVSTPQGVMSNKEAKEKGIGGRLLAFVY